jgi:hypothetical protein
VALLFEWVSCLPTALGCQLWEAENSVCRRFEPIRLGVKPASLLQHELLADVRFGSKADIE